MLHLHTCCVVCVFKGQCAYYGFVSSKYMIVIRIDRLT